MSFSSMLKTFYHTLPAIWAIMSLPFVNGSGFVTRNAGNCSSNEFRYEPIRECIPFGNQSPQSVPPYGVACPSDGNWYWSSRLSVCLPASPVSDLLGSVPCPSRHVWEPTMSRCTQVNRTQRSTCGPSEFWFSERATCLPRRDPNSPTIRCPSGWYWSTQQSNCAPADPEALLSLTCAGDFVWSPSILMCQRPASPTRRSPSSGPSPRPSPSSSPGQRSHRKSLKSRTISLCPAELDVCPILRAGDFSNYECIDPKYDLQHCGGCSLDGRGDDCTLIEGVWNVERIRSHCSVMTCKAGYAPSTDRRTCVKL